jgi:UPF0755 protein
LARKRESATASERTDAERERAREERERRRLAKAQSATPPPVVPPLPPPLAQPPPLVPSPPPLAESASAREDASLDPVTGEGFQLTDRPPPLAGSPGETVAGPHRSHLHRPHIPHRPHLHRPHIPRWRGRAARIGALLALILTLGVLAGGAALLVHHSERPNTHPIPAIVKVVIPEGYTRLQIAALAHADGLRGSYLTASKSSPALRPAHYDAPRGAPSLEGFLFPATYEMYAGASVSQLLSAQLDALKEHFGAGVTRRAKGLGITPYQMLIVASMIEREAAIAHDRPLVAAVIYNRLRQNMTLGIDATLRYALRDFTRPLTEAQLASDSPYNTRTHKGLPPTPISNPGSAAISAAAHPAKVSYLYYVAGADGCGEQVFSTSYAEFEKNASSYREALRHNGGQVPSCKKR